MREIEFRGLGYNNKWLYGHYSDETDGHSDFPCIIPFRNTESPSCWIVDRSTVGQYIGLKDKNMVKIYEGDKLKDEDEGFFIVRFDKNTARFVLDLYGVKGCLMEYGFDETVGDIEIVDTFGFNDFCSLNDFEVIGNIHERSENNDK